MKNCLASRGYLRLSHGLLFVLKLLREKAALIWYIWGGVIIQELFPPIRTEAAS